MKYIKFKENLLSACSERKTNKINELLWQERFTKKWERQRKSRSQDQ
jgi:hypothetical protein